MRKSNNDWTTVARFACIITFFVSLIMLIIFGASMEVRAVEKYGWAIIFARRDLFRDIMIDSRLAKKEIISLIVMALSGVGVKICGN